MLSNFIWKFIVYSAPSCVSQPVSFHRNYDFWPTLIHILSIYVMYVKLIREVVNAVIDHIINYNYKGIKWERAQYNI